MNALKTGAFAKHLLLPDDDVDEFRRLRLQLYSEWQPVGPTETREVERLVALFWRQQRIYKGESGLFTMYRQCDEGVAGVATALLRDGRETDSFTRILRIDSTTERSIGVTIQLLRKLQASRSCRTGLSSASDNSVTGGTQK
jgi:hypothetical protein